MTPPASIWLHAGAALMALAWTLLVLFAGRGRSAWLLAACGAAAALWAGAVAWSPATPFEGPAGALEVVRLAVWVGALMLLCSSGTAWRIGAAGLVIAALAGLPALGGTPLLLRLALALVVVLMAENLYRNATEAARWHVVLPAIALGGLGAFDVLLHADAVLSRAYSPALTDARAVLTALAAPLLAIAALRDRRVRREMAVSRGFVFHGATLVVAGIFLLAVGALSEALRQFGEPWTRTAQAALLGAAVLALALALSARSFRSRIRRTLTDNFFRARYDYRAEWLRCVATLSSAGDSPAMPAIRALADAVDSPAGVLLLRAPGWHGAGGWNARADAAEDPSAALRDGLWVAQPVPGEFPKLRAALPSLWLIVPLMHHRDGLVGAVLLARPRAAFTPDRETFDLLRMLGREVALFLAERQAAERLAQEAQLHAHAHRFAFVAHDVKNVANQLTLLLGNAEAHIANPEFQRDMLMTVRASADRINGLIARLRQPDIAAPDSVEPLSRLQALARHSPHRLEIEGTSPGAIAMPPEHFDSAVAHLLDNAAQASPTPIRICLTRHGNRAWLDIIDQGPGMTAEFVRDDLFRPLVTARPGGSGIGAWQARELLRRAGGDLEVTTAPGRGTTMRLVLPAVAA